MLVAVLTVMVAHDMMVSRALEMGNVIEHLDSRGGLVDETVTRSMTTVKKSRCFTPSGIETKCAQPSLADLPLTVWPGDLAYRGQHYNAGRTVGITLEPVAGEMKGYRVDGQSEDRRNATQRQLETALSTAGNNNTLGQINKYVKKLLSCIGADKNGVIQGYYFSWCDHHVSGGTNVNWTTAVDMCNKRNQQLISIDSQRKNMLVKLLVYNSGVDGVWTSGARRSDQQEFRWLTGRKMDADAGWHYTGVEQRAQPDNRIAEEQCVAVVDVPAGSGLALHDQPCSWLHHYVCQSQTPPHLPPSPSYHAQKPPQRLRALAAGEGRWRHNKSTIADRKKPSERVKTEQQRNDHQVLNISAFRQHKPKNIIHGLSQHTTANRPTHNNSIKKQQVENEPAQSGMKQELGTSGTQDTVQSSRIRSSINRNDTKSRPIYGNNTSI